MVIYTVRVVGDGSKVEVVVEATVVRRIVIGFVYGDSNKSGVKFDGV